jgi:hypothetical protein
LQGGTANDPIPAGHTALIRLAAVEGLDKKSCPTIVCCGGRMDLHGTRLSRTWVKLGASVNAVRSNKTPAFGPGDTVIKLAEAVTGWRVGDRINVTATSRSRVNQRQTLRPGPGIEPAYTEERLNPAKSPKNIDLAGLGKSASLGLYKVDGDELTICKGVTMAYSVYDKRAKTDETTRALSPEAGTVIVLRRIK